MSGGLKLSRKAGQSILIGGDVEVIIDQIQGSRVQVRVVAPRDVLVVRMPPDVEQAPELDGIGGLEPRELEEMGEVYANAHIKSPERPKVRRKVALVG